VACWELLRLASASIRQRAVGAQLVGAQPLRDGLNAGQMLAGKALKGLLLLGVEPEFDANNPSAALAAVQGAEMVVSLSSFKTGATEYADAILPIAAFAETSGTFVNAEGRVQSFHGSVKPQGDARPAWKVLRVLGTMLGLPGFGFETSEEVKAAALGDLAALPAKLNNATSATVNLGASTGGLELIKIVAVVLPLMGCVAYLTLWERKAIGWTQVRPAPTAWAPTGPNRAARRLPTRSS
jgi:NADH-quinone oxidoreductase subunit G